MVVDHEVVDGLDGGQVLGGLPLLVPPEHRAPGHQGRLASVSTQHIFTLLSNLCYIFYSGNVGRAWVCAGVVHVWCRCGAGVVQVWSPHCGAGVVQVWCRCGAGVVQVWCRCGAGAVQV